MMNHREHNRYLRILFTIVAFVVVSFSSLGTMMLSGTQSAWAQTIDGAAEGAVLFETHCAGCHPNGTNIIKRGKTLKLKPLTRRHLDSVDAIATFVTHGKGLMSAYGDILTPEEIETVSTYVWDQAQINWPH